MNKHIDVNGDEIIVGDMVTYNGGKAFKIIEFKMRSYGFVVYDGNFAVEPKYVQLVKKEEKEEIKKSDVIPKGFWNI